MHSPEPIMPDMKFRQTTMPVLSLMEELPSRKIVPIFDACERRRDSELIFDVRALTTKRHCLQCVVYANVSHDVGVECLPSGRRANYYALLWDYMRPVPDDWIAAACRNAEQL